MLSSDAVIGHVRVQTREHDETHRSRAPDTAEAVTRAPHRRGLGIGPAFARFASRQRPPGTRWAVRIAATCRSSRSAVRRAATCHRHSRSAIADRWEQELAAVGEPGQAG